MRLSVIVAAANNGTIGKDGTLPWHLRGDLLRFKSLTMGHAIVMGRRTFESIGRPLPGRRMIVVASQPVQIEQVETARSFAEAMHQVEHDTEVFAIGGARIYAEALPIADRVYLTRVDAEIDGDTFFPIGRLDAPDWELIEDNAHEAEEGEPFAYRFQVYDRRS